MASKLRRLSGEGIRPLSWLKNLIRHDLQAGFIGQLDGIVPDVCGDDIFCSGRRNVQPVDQGRVELWQEVEGVWWPGEAVGNWWDGFVRHAFLCEDIEAMAKAGDYVEHLLAYQDKDGYIGIYTAAIRYQHKGENGDIWTTVCILRMLLAFYRYRQDRRVLEAVINAVGRIMVEFPLDDLTRSPFHVERPQGGVGHSLMLTDVLRELYEITGNDAFAGYAARFYEAYSESPARENDMQPIRLGHRGVPLRGHAVHTAEHARSLLFWSQVAPSPEKEQLLENCLWKFGRQTTLSGVLVGDELIKEMLPTGESLYEYCVIHELLDTLLHLLRTTGVATYADAAENILFNAAMGARIADGSGITYLANDNQFALPGASKDPQLEYLGGRRKMSPAHQDVAVCCNPNAARIFPYYIESMWLENPEEERLYFALLGPSSCRTVIGGSAFHFEAITDYPFTDDILIHVKAAAVPRAFTLCIRKPSWAEGYSVSTSDACVSCESNWILIQKTWKGGDEIRIAFSFPIERVFGIREEEAIRRGPLVYAMPISYTKIRGRAYGHGFHDYVLVPQASQAAEMYFQNPGRAGSLNAELVRNEIDRDKSPWETPPLVLKAPMETPKGERSKITFVPMGCAPLRRVFFPVNWSRFDPRDPEFIDTRKPLILPPPDGHQHHVLVGI